MSGTASSPDQGGDQSEQLGMQTTVLSSHPTAPLPDPPSYHATMSLSAEGNFGFPSGYFVIKSLATGKVLDIELDDVSDGAEVILWPEKESSLVEGFRRPEADNQVFFIDTSGALCSRQSGHAIDVEDGRLVLRHRRPKMYPYPNAFSHPLPRFYYSSTTKQILIELECDPSFPTFNQSSPHWRQKSYFLSSVPLRRPRTMIEDVTDVVSSVFTAPLTPLVSFFGKGQASNATVEDVYRSDIDLREDEVMEEDRTEGEEADDSPENIRRVRVVGVTEEQNGSLSDAARLRRKWEILPVRRSRVSYMRS